MRDENGLYLSSISVRVSDGLTVNHPEKLHRAYVNRLSGVVKDRLGPLLFIPSRIDPTQAEGESLSRSYLSGLDSNVRVSVTSDWVTITMSAELNGRSIVLPKREQ